MLKQRVITALVLLAVLLPAMFAQASWPFSVVTLALIGAAGWEWGRLNGASSLASYACGGILVAVGVACLASDLPTQVPAAVWWVATGIWVLGGAFALKAGVPGWPHLWPAARLGLGLVVLATSWLAISVAKAQGVIFLLSVFMLVWVADMAAYAGGRTWGRRKLAVSISPGKSWEGVYTGMVAVVSMAVIWVLVEPADATSHSLYFRLFARFGWGVLLLAGVYLAMLSVMGDLLESLVKRAAGMKDSSNLLPGHGGVLDRIDALLPVFPAALALASL
jgi:phosphatidate cytidylyltransferase